MLEEHDRMPLTALDDLDLVRAQILDRPALRAGHLDVETCQLDTGREPRRVLLAREPGHPGGGEQQDDNDDMALHRVPISSPTRCRTHRHLAFYPEAAERPRRLLGFLPSDDGLQVECNWTFSTGWQ